MVKDDETVIQSVSLPFPPSFRHEANDASREFGELVNMTAEELKDWLGQEESAGSGWSKDDGSGETVGHER